MFIDYKEKELPQINKEFHPDLVDQEQTQIFNTLTNEIPFISLKNWENLPLDSLEEVLIEVYNYFSRNGGISFTFMEQNNIFSTIFQILMQTISEGSNLFNLVYDIINEIIFHSPETVDSFIFDESDITDIVAKVLHPFNNEECIEYSDFIPEMFTEPVFNPESINISIKIIYKLWQTNRKIDAVYQNIFLNPLLNLLKMKTNDNLERDIQIINCLGFILLKPDNQILQRRKEITAVFNAYSSIFEKFEEDQNYIEPVAKICNILSEILEIESSIIYILYQDGFYDSLPSILDYIFSNSVNAYAIIDIIYFIFESLSNEDQDEYNEVAGIENENPSTKIVSENELSTSLIVINISNLIGNEHYVSLIFDSILNTTVDRLESYSQDSPLFTQEEERIMSYLLDCLQQLVMIQNNPIIEYQRIDELFSVINEHGSHDFKISFNNFIIGLINTLPIDELHEFLRLDFLHDFFVSFISFDSNNADFVIDTIKDVLMKLNIENDDIISAYKDKDNIKDNEILLVIETFPEVLESFIDFEDENSNNAEDVLSKYYQDVFEHQ